MNTNLKSVKLLLRTCLFPSSTRRLFNSGPCLKNNIQHEEETHFGFTNVKIHQKSEKVYKVFAGNFTTLSIKPKIMFIHI